MDNRKMVILLPAYNEEKSIDPLVNSLLQNLHTFNIKIIICNDGSIDNTGAVIEKVIKNNNNIELLTHKINRGLGETIRDLFERAAEITNDEDIIIRMDCDNTHEPRYILKMIEKIDEGYDVVTASRFQNGGGQYGVPLNRAFISYCAQIYFRVMFGFWRLKEFSCGFRTYRASIIKKAIKIYGNDFIQLKELGFACTLEKLLKLKLLNAKFAEVGFLLRYDKKTSSSKMVASITTFGYLIMVVMYYWPFDGWYTGWKKYIKEYEDSNS